MTQRQQELNEVRARKEQAERTLELQTRELNATKPMVATGAVSEVEVLRQRTALRTAQLELGRRVGAAGAVDAAPLDTAPAPALPLPLADALRSALEDLGIGCEVLVMSAHRNPDKVSQYSSGAEARGIRVIIAGAGMAAHLAGAVASRTTLPVIGVPLPAGPLAGLDALLSTVMMPKGIPVATVAIGSHGAKNAAYLAAQILALGDAGLAARLREKRGM